MAPQILKVDARTVWVQSADPFIVPREIAAIPGVQVVAEPLNYRVALPSTSWMLPPVQAWAGEHRSCAPTEHRIVPGLYAHQKAALDFGWHREGLLLADQMGLGKTRAALCMAACRPGRRPVVILGPKYLADVWRREMLEVGLGELSILSGRDTSPEKWPRGPWIYLHYEIVEAWWSWLATQRPQTLIIDEAHFVRNGRSKRGKAARLLASCASQRILLTGTPVLNRVGELWHLLDLTTGPWTWGSPSDFRRRYAGASDGEYGLVDMGVTHEDELRERMAECYLRRTVAEAGLDLPQLRREVVSVPLDDEQREKYRKLLDGRDVRSIVNALFEGRASRQTLRWLGQLRKLTSAAKAKTSQELITGAVDQGEAVVAFAWERRMAERLGKDGLVVHGGIPQHTRDGYVRTFQEGVAPQTVLAATYGALGTGATLHRARIVLLHDLDWVPAVMLQAEARVYRIGQKLPVTSLWVVAKDTLDEYIARLVIEKAHLIEGAVADGEPLELAGVLDAWADRDVVSDHVAKVLEWANGQA